MPKYINADEMILRYQSLPNRHSKDCLTSITYEDVVDAVIYDLEQEASVDAKPVKHGHWINKTVCSICGEWEDFNDGYRRYCPNCGARMDEVIDE